MPTTLAELLLALMLLLQTAGASCPVELEEAVPEMPLSEATDPADSRPAPASLPDEEPVGSDPPPEPVETPSPTRSVWDDLADCESGNWIDGGASFEEGSARWAWGGADPVPPWGTSLHHGGLQFHPDTWTWLAPEVYPARAYEASREQQIHVAEITLEMQGWGAWPVCSKKLGLR